MNVREIENIVLSIFKRKAPEAIESTPLILPLERSGSEQMEYAHWKHSTRIENFIEALKVDVDYFGEGGQLIQLDVPLGFKVNYDPTLSVKDFLFLFDYIKDEFLEIGFELKKSMKSCFEKHGMYVEQEVYSLVFHQPDSSCNISVECTIKEGVPMQVTAFLNSLEAATDNCKEAVRSVANKVFRFRDR